MNNLRYPIGPFPCPDSVTEEQRKSWIRDIAEAPGQMREAVSGLTEAQLDTPYRPGGWTLRQVVHHLPDGNLHGYLRFKLALTEDHPTIKPYEEARWAELADSRAPISVSLDLLEAVHSRWSRLLLSMTAVDFERTFHHPDSGEMTLNQALALYSWHSRHHIAHVTFFRRRTDQ